MLIIRCLAASTLAGASALAGAQADRSSVSSMPVPQMQRIYLECDRAASIALLDMATASYCSVIAEELLERGFGGDFNRLLGWWERARLDEPASQIRPESRPAPTQR